MAETFQNGFHHPAVTVFACRTSLSKRPHLATLPIWRESWLSPHSPPPTLLSPPPPAGELLALTCHGDYPALCQEPREGCWTGIFPPTCSGLALKVLSSSKVQTAHPAAVAAGLRGHLASDLGACIPGRWHPPWASGKLLTETDESSMSHGLLAPCIFSSGDKGLGAVTGVNIGSGREGGGSASGTNRNAMLGVPRV